MNVNSVIQIVCLCVQFVCVGLIILLDYDARKKRREAREMLADAERYLKRGMELYQETLDLTSDDK